jgi:hypothetical protein
MPLTAHLGGSFTPLVKPFQLRISPILPTLLYEDEE